MSMKDQTRKDGQGDYSGGQQPGAIRLLKLSRSLSISITFALVLMLAVISNSLSPAAVRAAAPEPTPTAGGGGGFDFGGSNGVGGDGHFSKYVDQNGRAMIGTIPAGIKDLNIRLDAENDLDIELWDGSVFVVGWLFEDEAALISSGSEVAGNYNGVKIQWSGWNGVGGKLGDEYIRLEGVTQNDYVMKVFGYRAGTVDVDYSWAGVSGEPAAEGSGNFTKYVDVSSRIAIGTIPAGIANLAIDLTAENDLDIELWDGNTFVVDWKANDVKAQIWSNDQITDSYNGVTITWSGWDGVGGHRGNEILRLNGTTRNSFEMKVFGFQAGTVNVDYRWGEDLSVIFDVGSITESLVGIIAMFEGGAGIPMPINIVGTIQYFYETGIFEIKVPEIFVKPGIQLLNLIDEKFGTSLSPYYYVQAGGYGDPL